MSHPPTTNLKDPAHPYHRAPRGMWLIVRTPVAAIYPCRCRGKCSPLRCPCAGRDIKGMPTVCCARRAAESEQRRESETPE